MRLLYLIAATGMALTSSGSALAAAPAPVPAAPKLASADPGISTFGVQAATQHNVDTRPHFAYTAVPGADIVDYVAISNYSSSPLSLKIYAGDAFTNQDGGFDLTASSAKPRDLGTWVTIANSSVTLAARTRSILPFRLAVPANASPGDHVGGIVASFTVMSHGKRGDQVTVEHRLAERIYLRVPGALRPTLAVSEVHTTFAGPLNPLGRGRASTSYRITNTGNVRLGAKVVAQFHSLLGSTSAGTHSVPELLPGSSLVFTGSGRLLPAFRASTRVAVTPVRLAADGEAGSAFTVSHGFWTIPWSLLALIAMVAVTVAVLRRRASRRPTPAHATGRHSRPSARRRPTKLEVS